MIEVVRMGCLSLLLWSFTACVQEGEPFCGIDCQLSLRVVNGTGEEITSGGAAGETRLYLFDEQRLFFDSLTLSAPQVLAGESVHLRYPQHKTLWVVAWSNLGNRQQLTPLTRGLALDSARVQLKRSAQGYVLNPNDLFFAIQKLEATPLQTRSPQSVVLSMTRKVAQMNISIRGLNMSLAPDYHIVVQGSQKDAYDFNGHLVGQPVRYDQLGGTDRSDPSFWTTSAFLLFPSEGGPLALQIYQGRTLITIAINNVNGEYIVAKDGVTTHVLIDTTVQLAELVVGVQITPWDEYYSWVRW